MKKFKIGDKVKWGTGGKIYKGIVIKVKKNSFVVDVESFYSNLEYSYAQPFGWVLVDQKKELYDKIKQMYERQPYVQRIKQCCDTTNNLSGMS